MILKTIPNVKKLEEGDYKVEKRFAWWPRRVENKVIWLETYKRVFIYQIRQRVLIYPGIATVYRGVWGNWDLITEQLIAKK